MKTLSWKMIYGSKKHNELKAKEYAYEIKKLQAENEYLKNIINEMQKSRLRDGL